MLTYPAWSVAVHIGTTIEEIGSRIVVIDDKYTLTSESDINQGAYANQRSGSRRNESAFPYRMSSSIQ